MVKEMSKDILRKPGKAKQGVIFTHIDKLRVLERGLWWLTFSGFRFLVYVLFVKQAKITAMKNPPEKRNYGGKNQTPPVLHIGVEVKSGSYMNPNTKEHNVSAGTLHFYFVADDITDITINTDGISLKVGDILYMFHYTHDNGCMHDNGCAHE